MGFQLAEEGPEGTSYILILASGPANTGYPHSCPLLLSHTAEEADPHLSAQAGR